MVRDLLYSCDGTRRKGMAVEDRKEMARNQRDVKPTFIQAKPNYGLKVRGIIVILVRGSVIVVRGPGNTSEGAWL